MGAVSAVGFVSSAARPATLGGAILAVSLTEDYDKKVRSWTKQVGATAAWEGNLGNTEKWRKSEPRIRAFLESGATHVFVDRKLNLHFIRAPKYEGKEHLPFIGRMRAPLSYG